MAKLQVPYGDATIRGDKLFVETEGRFTAASIIENTKAIGWNSIDLVALEPHYRKAVWLEGSMNGVKVFGYRPTAADKLLLARLSRERRTEPGKSIALRAEDVVSHYERRVIPALKRKLDSFGMNRRKHGANGNGASHEHGFQAKSRIGARELEARLSCLRESLNKALEARDYFLGLRGRGVQVCENFEDGVCRYMPEDLKQRRILQQGLSQGMGRGR